MRLVGCEYWPSGWEYWPGSCEYWLKDYVY